MGLTVAAPLAGTAGPLAEVPDPVFAAELVGPGLAVLPRDDARVVTAPLDGRLVKVKPHAFVVADDAGHAVLVHLGIDTVTLGGTGFAVLAREGATVVTGEPVVRWDPVAVAAGGRSPICPVIALDTTAGRLALRAPGPVRAGEPLFTWD